MDIKGFHVVSYNCKPFVSLQLEHLHSSPVAEIFQYKELLMNCNIFCILFLCLQHCSTNLFKNPPETLYFWCPSSLLLHFSLLLPQFPHRRPLAVTACRTACLSLFYQPLFALCGCSSCGWWMSLPLLYSISPKGTIGQNVGELHSPRWSPLY